MKIRNMVPPRMILRYSKTFQSTNRNQFLFRANATVSRAALAMDEGDLEEVAEWFRTALDMFATDATEEEKSRLVRQSHVPDERDSRFLENQSVKDILEMLQRIAKECLNSLENPTIEWKLSAGGFPVRSVAVGGGTCDGCGKKRTEVRGGLSRCSKCKLAYYCSSDECQQKQWKAGHKKHCRAPGDIRVGDEVRLRRLVNSRDLNANIGAVVRPAPGGRWEIKVPNPIHGAEMITVAPENLTHIRPKVR